MRVHFVLIFGPPAVGKMTVGHELAKRTGFKLSGEPVLDIFEFGSPPFNRLVDEDGGATVHFVELHADRAERLVRNRSAFRLEQKRSREYLRLDNTNLGAPDAAEAIMKRYGFAKV